MNTTFTPILANGLAILDVLVPWVFALLITTGLALVGILLAVIKSTRKASRWLTPFCLAVSFAPGVVLVCYASYMSRSPSLFNPKLPVWIALSLGPIVLAAFSVRLSRRKLPGK